MLRIITSASADQAKKYLVDGLAIKDYYSEGQEVAGLWGGKGAALLGLKGIVDKEAFCALCDNLNPATGERLTARTKDNRRVGWDLNFHVPKSVTLAYEFRKDERILKLVRRAIQETMEELEQDVSTRVRVGGQDHDRKTGKLIWAEYIHFTARPVNGIPDPHLHVHCFTFNATYDEQEGRWKAAQLGDVKRDASYYEAAFHARVALGLEELGYRVEPVGSSFELGGVSRELIEKFSRRAAVVEAKAKEIGAYTAAERDGLAALTRERKVKELSKDELRKEWWSRLTPEEKEQLKSLGRARARSAEASREAKAVQYAIDHIFERSSVVGEKALLAEALRWGVGSVKVDGIRVEAAKADLIRVPKDGRNLVTTEEVLAEEERIAERCKAGKDQLPRLNPGWQIEDHRLNMQQRAAVVHVLESRDRITGVGGKAGTGKTTLLKEAARAIEAGGQRLLVLAPTAEAARGVLRKEGFEKAETVAQLLSSPILQDEARGAVWWVDEAGLLSSRCMDKMLDLAENLGSRIVLVGDVGQHYSVERGRAFEILEQFGEMSVVSVDKVQRQQGLYKKAVEEISERRFDAAFDTLKGMGAFREISGKAADRHQAVALDYRAATRAGKSALVVSPTHAECEDVTTAIRQMLKEEGTLEEGTKRQVFKPLTWTVAERGDSRKYSPGMMVHMTRSATGFPVGEQLEVVEARKNSVWVRAEGEAPKELPLTLAERFSVFEKDAIEVGAGEQIRITANGKTLDGHRLNNGSVYTVRKLEENGDMVLGNGWRLPKEFGHLGYGYAITSHAAQGKTVDRVFVVQSGISMQAADANQFYVSVSRGRELVRVYTDNVEALRSSVGRERERPAALEVVPPRNRAKEPPQERPAEKAEEVTKAEEMVKTVEAAAKAEEQKKVLRPPEREEAPEMSM
jgi:conjugative relaxase-like TrwC/TraI family protein